MKSEAEVVELLRELSALQDHDPPLLSESETEAFPSMLEQVEGGRRLSPKQMEWILGAAERLDLKAKNVANAFSDLPPARQQEHLLAARRVLLPWERGQMARPLRPPGK